MAFSVFKLLKGILISEENTLTPKEIEITPGGTASTKTSIVSSQTTNRTITLPDATSTLATTSNKLSAFAATTSAELAGVISDETGSGSLVFGTSPTLVTPTLGVATATSLISPSVYGGSSTTSALTLKSTSGVGTTNADIIFQVGNNGATEAMRVLNSGNVGIGTAAPRIALTIGALSGSWGGSTTGIKAEIIGANAPTAEGGNLRILTSTSHAVDVGGSIALGGNYSTTANAIDFAVIAGRKENPTDPNTAGYLSFGTRVAAGNTTEKMRIDSTGSVGINNTNPSGIVGSTAGGFVLKDGGRSGSTTQFAITDSSGVITMSVLQNGTTLLASLAGTGSRAVNADASGNLSASSDSRLKEEQVSVVVPGLAEILQLQPKAYKWLSDIAIRGEDAAVEIGFFADQVAPIIPSAAPLCKDGMFGFYDRSVTAALVKAIQELSNKNAALEARLTAAGI
jgi:hypothetical protein